MGIFRKGTYLSEEEYNEFLRIWDNQPVITEGLKSKLVNSGIFKDKFQVGEDKIKKFFDNEIFKRIIHRILQNLNGFTVPLFYYDVKKKRYLIIQDPKAFLKNGCLRYLKWAKTCSRYDPKLAEEIQCLIDKMI
jgi:phosphorylcholine metabolism protein LicD